MTGSFCVSVFGLTFGSKGAFIGNLHHLSIQEYDNFFLHLFYESVAYLCTPICNTCHNYPLIFLLLLVSSPSARSSRA